jgi:hypothetical protein
MRNVVSVKHPEAMEPPLTYMGPCGGVCRRLTDGSPLTRRKFLGRDGCSPSPSHRLPQPRHASSRGGLEPGDNMNFQWILCIIL